MPFRKIESDKDRFFRFVDKGAGSSCWLWTGAVVNGYGAFHTGSRSDKSKRLVKAHRFVMALVGNAPADDMDVDHLCRNKRCVNPQHLQIVTEAENTIRWAQTITHCPNGHPYSGENVRYIGNKRACRTCDRLRKTPTRERAWHRYR